MATWVWVRALPWNVPARRALQLEQAQFHWGNPPPAAEPRIFTRMLSECTTWNDRNLQCLGAASAGIMKFLARGAELPGDGWFCLALGGVSRHTANDPF